MIYFDENKKPYGFEIPDPIATVDSDTWLKYAGTDKWDIIAGQFLDITDTPEYQQKQLKNFKLAKTAKNNEAKESKEFINTPFGKVKMQTPVGRVDVMATGFLNVVNITGGNLPAGSFRIYNEDNSIIDSSELTTTQVAQLYMSVFNAFNLMDKRYAEINNAIDRASNADELDLIVVDYADI